MLTSWNRSLALLFFVAVGGCDDTNLNVLSLNSDLGQGGDATMVCAARDQSCGPSQPCCGPYVCTPVAAGASLCAESVLPTDMAVVTGPWSTMSSNTTTDLYGLWGDSPTNIYAVGGTPGATAGNPGVIVRWDGSAWSATSNLVNLLGISGNIAVGEYGGEGSAIYGAGSTWSSREVLAPGSTRGVMVEAFGAYAVGDSGRLLFTTEPGVAGSWGTLTSGTPEFLRGLWGVSPGATYAVGDSGTILRATSASAITPAPGAWAQPAGGSGSSSSLRGVWGTGSDVYVVGESPPVILHSSNGGTSWSKVTLPVGTGGLFAVWGSASTDLYAVGAAGGIVHSAGSDVWTTVASPTSKDLLAVWGASDGHVYAVGQSGTIIRK